MAHLSPRTKFQVHQINVFKKATGRTRRMVAAELIKKAEPPPPAKKKTPLKGAGTTIKNVCPVPASPRPIKRNRAEEHAYDSSAELEERRSVAQRNGVVPAVSGAEVQPAVPAHNNIAALDSVHQLHRRTSPSKGNLRPSPVRLASVIERPAVANDVQLPLPSRVVPNGCHTTVAETDVHIEQCSAHYQIVEAYRVVDNSETCADGDLPTPDTAQIENFAASSQAIGFENLLRRVGSPERVCPSVVCASSLSPSSVGPDTESNVDSGAVTLIPSVQSVLTQPASPEYVLPPSDFRGLWNLGNTCYMNTVIQLLYNLECFSSDIVRLAELPLPSDGILKALQQVFQFMAQSVMHAVVSPACLQHASETYMTDFEGSVQQDAQEYLLNVLDKIEEEITRGQRQLFDKYQVSPADRESICPTTRNFSCQVRNILSCEGCDNVVNVEQSCRHFSLPLPEDRRDPQAEVPDIEALLNIFFQVETLSRKCEKCGAETMKSETKIVQLPRVLILHINRFEIDRQMLCSKVSVPVKFADSLDLGHWCVDKVRGPSNTVESFCNGIKCCNGYLPALEDCRENSHSGGHTLSDPQEVRNSHLSNGEMYDSKENGFAAASSTSYSLYGVVSHVGKLASSGHYTVDIFDVESSKYVRCDDALVREVSPEDVFCEEKFSEAYVLLYVR